MGDDKRKPAAASARTGGSADLMAGDPNELKDELSAIDRHPQGAGGVDVARDEDRRSRSKAKRRLARVLR